MAEQTIWWDEPGLRRSLRLAAGLAHTVPAATLVLDLVHGPSVIVSHIRPDADLTPCELRRLLLDVDRPRRVDPLRHVERWTLGGSLHHLGAGVYGAAHPSEAGVRRFATAIEADAVTALAQSCPEGLDVDGAEATIRPDLQLGVSVVTVTALGELGGPPAEHVDIDRLACWLAGVCMVEELLLPDGPPSVRR